MRQSSVFSMESLERRQLLSVAVSGVLLSEQFQRGVNRHDLFIPTWKYDGDGTYYGRTQIRCTQNSGLPTVKNRAVQIVDDSYNPTGLSFYGTELISKKYFSLGNGVDTGLDITFVAKLNGPIANGEVGGLFVSYLEPDGVNHNEIDFELLSNQANAKRHGNRIETNVFSNQPFDAGTPAYASLPDKGVLTGYHTYKIQSLPGEIDFYVDGTLVRADKSIVPTGSVQVHMNMWTPDSTWPEAYSNGIQPVSDSGSNKEFGMSVKSVVVSSLSVKQAPPVQPGIFITRVPPMGTSGYAYGNVSGVKLSDYSGVAVYIKVNGLWWNKPYWTSPESILNSDGTWSADIATGGDDIDATEVNAYLIPNGFTIPLVGGGSLPSSLSGLMYASASR